MRRLVVLATAGAIGLVVATGAASAPKPPGPPQPICVGKGPKCYPTLSAALAASKDGDTIQVGPGTFTGGVTILDSVTLVGVDAHASKISGGGPVVTIGSTSTAPTVTIEDLTITGGVTTTNPHAPACGLDVPVCGPGYADSTAIGGGIETFAGTDVTLMDSVVTGNRATPAHTTSSVKATCANGPCAAAFGDAAGIDVWGTMTLVDSTVSDNHASAPAQSNGGGIAVHSGASLSLQGSQVVGNSAAATAPTGRFVSGGGIYVNSDATLTVANSSIDHNSALLASSLASPYPIQDGNPDSSSATGGGVFLNDGSTATISNSTLDGNSVSVNTPNNQAYGADAALCACGGVSLSVDRTHVSGNTLDVRALASDNNGPSGPSTFEADGDGTTITNTEIDHNTADVRTSGDSAGVIAAVAFFPGDPVTNTITNSSIDNNAVTADSRHGTATILGAGLLNNGLMTISNSTISHNRGEAHGQDGTAQGGGIWNGQLFGGPTSPLTLQNSQVTDNQLRGDPGVTLSGGGIYTLGFPTTLTNTVVAHNKPDDCVGC
jgi:hypothetical protein